MVEYDTNASPMVFPTYFTRSGNVVTINADDNNQAKTYTMKVIHSTPDNGDITYNSVTISIGWCVITGIDPPTAPTASEAAYIVFSGAKQITLTP